MNEYFDDNMQTFDVLYDDEIWSAGEEQDGQPNCSAEDALILSINRFGRVNLPFMAEISGKTEVELISALEGRMIWKDPSCYDPAEPCKGWVTEMQYAVGNIHRLLEDARMKNDSTGLFDSNIELLTSRLPEMPPAEEIVIMLGATWVPAEHYLKFIGDLLDMSEDAIELSYDDYFMKWILKGKASYSFLRNTSTYGTVRMPALKIIERTMNAGAVKVYDRFEDPVTGEEKSVINRQETTAAQEKQRLIMDEFQEWLRSHPEILSELHDIYSEKFCYRVPQYDGFSLSFPGMNPGIRLYSHQKAAIARIVLSPDNVLLNHEVGAGKTYVMAAGIHERLRMGISRKALFVVPNAVLDATVQSFGELYPDDVVDAVYPSDFVPAKRGEVLDRIRDTESGVFIMASSSFDFIDMSGCFYLEKIEDEIRACRAECDATRDYSRKISLMNRLTTLSKERDKFSNEYVDKETDCFDVLGIDLLVVDECHNYKNIKIGSMETVAGLSTKGSKKACRMLEKCDFVREGGGKIVFATGTPLTNSMAELYVLQRYLQPMDLEILKVKRFNDWVNTFSTMHTEFEVDPTAASFRFMTRFDSFHNLPELMSIFGNVCDFYSIDRKELGLPDFNGFRNVTVPRSEAQKEYIDEIAERSARLHSERVSRKEDNYLKITSDGRKCALDIRLVTPDADEEKGSINKVSAAVSVIRRIYEEYPGMTQAVFCDMSTPSDKFNVYDETRRLLMEQGIPGTEIAFIHDGKNERGRKKILRDFNAGTIRILLGSTAKLGTGVNIQERLVAVHHLDAPWKPADLTQRDGRAIRQGNCNKEVFIYRYVTEASFDAYTWQILENKQKFIASFFSGNLDASKRSERDIGETILDYAEIKALAIGNPLIKERVEVNIKLSRARSASYRRIQELRRYQELLSLIPVKCELLRKQSAEVEKDIRCSRRRKGPANKEDKERIGYAILSAIWMGTRCSKEEILFSYRGFKVIVPGGLKPDKPYILLTRDRQTSYRVEMKDAKAAGCCTRMDNVLNSLEDRRQDIEAKISSYESMLRDAKEQIRAGNPMDTEVNSLKEQLDSIDEELGKENENEQQ